MLNIIRLSEPISKTPNIVIFIGIDIKVSASFESSPQYNENDIFINYYCMTGNDENHLFAHFQFPNAVCRSAN